MSPGMKTPCARGYGFPFRQGIVDLILGDFALTQRKRLGLFPGCRETAISRNCRVYRDQSEKITDLLHRAECFAMAPWVN